LTATGKNPFLPFPANRPTDYQGFRLIIREATKKGSTKGVRTGSGSNPLPVRFSARGILTGTYRYRMMIVPERHPGKRPADRETAAGQRPERFEEEKKCLFRPKKDIRK
jgi:hypothetical protein